MLPAYVVRDCATCVGDITVPIVSEGDGYRYSTNLEPLGLTRCDECGRFMHDACDATLGPFCAPCLSIIFAADGEYEMAAQFRAYGDEELSEQIVDAAEQILKGLPFEWHEHSLAYAVSSVTDEVTWLMATLLKHGDTMLKARGIAIEAISKATAA